MTKQEATEQLIEAVEAGRFDPMPEYPTGRLNDFLELAESVVPQDERGLSAVAWHAYNGSLYAAKALHDALLPGEGWEVRKMALTPGMILGSLLPGKSPDPYRAEVGWNSVTVGEADDPARAWLLAQLRFHLRTLSKIEQETD